MITPSLQDQVHASHDNADACVTLHECVSVCCDAVVIRIVQVQLDIKEMIKVEELRQERAKVSREERKEDRKRMELIRIEESKVREVASAPRKSNHVQDSCLNYVQDSCLNYV